MRVVGYTKVIPPGAKANNKPQKENHKTQTQLKTKV